MELVELKEPYLCLNMIVKNEGHIIKDTLTKLLNKIPEIDYWVISDTGSTDKTKEIISDFFKERNIKGELFDDEWKDFGHNRTLALEHAYKKSKFLLIFDADDEICGDFVLPDLKVDSYHLQFGDSNGTSYTRTQIINNQKKWKYVGVLHEIITCTEHTNGMDIIKGNYYTISGKSGSRSQDQNKYQKDALVLEKAYEEAVKNNDDLYNRYGFYCANSYYDCGKFEDAIKWYKITLDNKNWSQEKYVSCLRLYNCYNALNQKETGIFYLVKSFSYDKERAECLYELVSYYCCNEMNEVAYGYYTIAKSFYNEKYLTHCSNDKLFVDVSKANLLLPYYMILVGDKVQDHDTTIQMYRIIFTKKHIERSKHYIGNMLYNLQFFIERVKDDSVFLQLFQEYIDFLISINYPVYEHDFMVKYEKYGIKVDKFSEQVFSLDECIKSKNILVYAGYAPFKWNYTFSLNNALGGSETAVSSLTKNFPKDYTIYVAGEVEEETVENIQYVSLNNLKKLIKTTAFHTIIVSRYLNFYELYKDFSAYQTYIWGHDITLYAYGTDLSVESILKKWETKITGCICQTEWHKNLFLSSFPQLKDKITTINNGINVDLFNSIQVKKVTNRFIYTSCSERGLYKLVKLWPSILENLPDAELMISSYNTFPNSEEDNKILEIINKTPSIKHLGKLNRSDLYNLMGTAEYWLYPSYFQETSCITSLELLASEVICLYYPIAGLVNTVGDYGIAISDGNEIEKLLSLFIKKKSELKRRGKEYALSCSWQNRAIEWSKLLFLHNDSLNITNDKNQLSTIEKRMFYLYDSFSMPEAHKKMLKTISDSFTPKVIYDIGSNTLHWTKEAKNIWTNAEIFAFDAIQEAEELYKSKNVKYNIGVLSNIDNKIVKFYENKENPAGNSYYKEIGHPNSVNIFPEDSYSEKIAMTLETVVKRNHFLLPDLVKIDVQGAELDILNGGMNIINNAKYLIIELQNVEYNRGAPLENITIDFLNKNGWEIVEAKFSNNGPDADYLFINNNYKISDNNEGSKDIWVFSPGTYMYTPVIQYIENLSDYKKTTIISNDINYINHLNPHKIIFLLNPSSSELFERNILDKFINTNFAFLQLEPMTLSCHLNHIISYFNKYSYLKQYPIYDYSKTNIRILNENGFTNCIHLHYNCQPSELDFLIKSNTKNKEYDFGYIYDWIQVNNGVKSFPIKPPRRNKVTEFLIKNGFTVNLIAGYGEDRDSELGKCKIILNIHGQINENPNPSPDECSNIFEHIRCDRLLKAGYTILSETSYDLDQDFIDKYPNLKIINYEDFFNLDVINNIIYELNIKNIYDKTQLGEYRYDTYNKNKVDSDYDIENLMLRYGQLSNTDKVTHHEYHKYYEPVLKPYYNSHGSIVEIGLGTTASLPMWKDIFKHAHIYGVDIEDTYFVNDRCTIYKADQSKIDDLNRLKHLLSDKNVFFINDDGSHIPEHQLLTFNTLFPILLEGGIYIIEDIETSYWTTGACYNYETRYGYKNPKSIIEIFKDVTDIINREFIADNTVLSNQILHYDYIESVTFARNCIIIKKKYNATREYRFKMFTPIKIQPKIIDCFIFYNELDLLNYRLNILNNYVDYFVLVEATHSFVGKIKPLFYEENKELFKEFNHKIIHIVVDDFSHKYPNINIENGEQWNNEIFQRNCIKRGLDKLKLNDDDIFTITDLDEIPDPKLLQKIKATEVIIDANILEQDFYYYNLNSKLDFKWHLSKIISYKKYKEFSCSFEQIRQNMTLKITKNGGWHLSYFGNEQFIKNKIENFSHQELNIKKFTDENKILNRIKNKLDVYDRYNINIVNVPIEDNNNLPPAYDKYLTKYYTNNIQNIKSNLIKYSNLRDDICHFENYDNYINWQTKLGLSFEKDNTEWMNGQRKCVERNFNNIERNIKILDICCGDGQGLKKFKEMGFKNVYGVEVCKEKINFAKQYGYTIYECDICCGPFEIGDNYDCIYSSHTIEHVLNPEYTIRNIMSKLKDNGIFILILPYPDYGAANSLDEHRFKIHCGVIPLGLHINDKGYTICNTIRKMGYKITDCRFESYREPEIQLIITK